MAGWERDAAVPGELPVRAAARLDAGATREKRAVLPYRRVRGASLGRYAVGWSMVFKADDGQENSDWTKGSGPRDLGISSREQFIAYLRSNHMTLREFAKLPVFYRSKDEWLRILGK